MSLILYVSLLVHLTNKFLCCYGDMFSSERNCHNCQQTINIFATIATETTKSIVTATEAITPPPLSMPLHHHHDHHCSHNDISTFLLLMMLLKYHSHATTTSFIAPTLSSPLHCCHLYLAHTTITMPTTFTSIATTKTPMPLECLLLFSPHPPYH
jgi:hypothetical protein